MINVIQNILLNTTHSQAIQCCSKSSNKFLFFSFLSTQHVLLDNFNMKNKYTKLEI